MIGSLVLASLLVQPPPASRVPPQAVGAQPPSVAKEAPEKPWPPVGVSRVGAGVSAPEVVYEARPKYTTDARAARIQGCVEMDVVVLTDGTVGDVRVVQSLDDTYGLDDEAVAAVKRWVFKPGKKERFAVPVVVTIEMTFTLRK